MRVAINSTATVVSPDDVHAETPMASKPVQKVTGEITFMFIGEDFTVADIVVLESKLNATVIDLGNGKSVSLRFHFKTLEGG